MRRGATLAELLVALVILATLAGIAAPRAAALMDRARVQGARTEVTSTIALARQRAIQRGVLTTLRIDQAGGTLLVYSGTDTAQRTGVGREYRVTLRATRDSIRFMPNGLGYGGGNMTITIRRRSAVDTVIVSRLGRVRH